MKCWIKFFVAFYIINYYVMRLITKCAVYTVLPIVDSLTLFESVENMLKRHSGSAEKALDDAKKGTFEKVPFDAINLADKELFLCFQLFIWILFSLFSLAFNWHLLWTLWWNHVEILILILLIPGILLTFALDIPTDKDKITAISYVEKHSIRSCLLFCIIPMLTVFILFILWMITSYIVFFIMRGDVSSYDAIRMFFQNPLCGFNK